MRIILCLFVFWVGIANEAFANNDVIVHDGFFLGQYQEGVVSKAPYKDKYLKIKVDKLTYLIMDECEIFKIVKEYDGKQYQEAAKLSALKKGTKVAIKVHGNRIFRIMIL